MNEATTLSPVGAEAMHLFYLIRALGGLLFLSGALLMVYNIWKTIADPTSQAVPEARPAMVPAE